MTIEIKGEWSEANPEQAEGRFGERTYPDGTTNYHWVLEYDNGMIGYYDTTHRREIFRTANEAIEEGQKQAFKQRFTLRKVILE